MGTEPTQRVVENLVHKALVSATKVTLINKRIDPVLSSEIEATDVKMVEKLLAVIFNRDSDAPMTEVYAVLRYWAPIVIGHFEGKSDEQDAWVDRIRAFI